MEAEIFFIGHLGRDPEIRYTANGKKLATFSVAVSSRRRNEEESHTDWYRVTAWGGWVNEAENLAKGTKVAIRGRLRLTSWQASDGREGMSAEVTAQWMGRIEKTARKPKESTPSLSSSPMSEDEIPF